MKNTRTLTLIAISFSPFLMSSARAVSNSWNVNANGNWTTAGSWLGGVNIPGSTTTDNTDIATFSFTLGGARTVTVDTDRYIGGIDFGNTSNFGYTLSSGILHLNSGGVIQTLAGNGNHIDTINSAIVISGTSAATATFTANATSASSLLKFGTGATTLMGSATSGNTTTLTLNGSNTGINVMSTIISDGGGGGKLAVVKDGTGTWEINPLGTSGSANTFTGGVTLNNGLLRFGKAGSFGTGALTINGGSIDAITGITTGTLAQNWNGDFTFVGTAAWTVNSGGVTLGGNRKVTVSASTLTIGGSISDGINDYSLTKAGAGTLVLSTSNTISGNVTVAEGTLKINNASGLNVANVVTVGGSATAPVLDTLTSNTIAGLNDGGFTNGTVTNSSAVNRTLTLGGSGTYSYGGIITATTPANLQLTKNGTATQTLAGTNTYTGNTLVSGGTLQFAKQVSLYNNGAAAAWTSTNIRVDSGATMAFNIGGTGEFTKANIITLLGLSTATTNGFKTGSIVGLDTTSGDFLYDSVIANPNSGTNVLGLTKLGTNKLTLNQINTYTGGTKLDAGTLTLANVAALGSAGQAVSLNGGKLDLHVDTSVNAYNVTVGGNVTIEGDRATSGNGIVNTFGTLSIGTNTLSITTNTADNVLSGTDYGVTFGATSLTGNATFDVANNAAGVGTLTLGAISETGGAHSLTKQGAGTLLLSSATTYSGGTNITAGTLTLGNTNTLADTSTVTVSGTGILNIAALTDTVGTFNMSAGSLNGSGTLTATTYGLTGGTVNALLGAGAVTVNTGTVTLGSAGRLNSSSSLLIQGGQLTLAGAETVASFQQTGGTLAGAYTLTSAAAYDMRAGTVSANLGGSVGLNKSTVGTVTLNGTNTYTGTTTVSGGILEVTANNALGTNAAGTSVTAGAALKLTGVSYSTTEALSINGSGISGGGALVNSGTSTFAGQVTAATSATINAGGGNLSFTGGLVKNGTVLTLTGGGVVNVGTVGISGSSSNSDLVVDGVTLNANVANTYNGPTFIRSTAIAGTGIFNANVVDALPTSLGRSAVTMDDSGLGSSQLNLTASQSIASLTGASTSTVNLGGNTLTIGTASSSTTFAGVISGSGGSLTKDGASTQVLSGTSGYTGATNVTDGTLVVTGNISTSSLTTVSSGATLAGTGTLGATTIQGGATLSPGLTGVGILSTGTLTLNALSTYLYDVESGTANADLVNVGGILTIETGTILDLVQLGTYAVNQKFTLFGYTGIGSGTFKDTSGNVLTDGATFTDAGGIWKIDYNDTVGLNGGSGATTTSFVTITAIPEPNAAALLGGLGTLMLLRRRR